MDSVGGSKSVTTRQTGLPQRRVVLLGASNIARSLPVVFDTARNAWGSPLDIIAATGHGRSYGMSSRVFGRTLPGIVQSGLWNDLAARQPVPTAALLTDIGNDILYGATVAQIVNWVELCVEQLRPLADHVTITQLPIGSISDLGRARFLAMRTILFPKSRLKFSDALDHAIELNERVKQLAEQHDATIFQPQRNWYGLDPIHIKRCHQTHAWKQILSTWMDGTSIDSAQQSWLRWLKTYGIRPQSRHLFGIHQQQQQPAQRLSDGSLISLY